MSRELEIVLADGRVETIGVNGNSLGEERTRIENLGGVRARAKSGTGCRRKC